MVTNILGGHCYKRKKEEHENRIVNEGKPFKQNLGYFQVDK